MFRLVSSWHGQKILSTALAAKEESLSIALGLKRSRFIDGHSADGIFSRGFRFIHNRDPPLIVVVAVLKFQFWCCFRFIEHLYSVSSNACSFLQSQQSRVDGYNHCTRGHEQRTHGRSE